MRMPSVLDPVAAYALWAANYPPCAHNPLMQAEERAMLSLLAVDLRGCNVIDVGCGSGRYLRHVEKRSARCMLGVDLSEPMLAQVWPRTQSVTTSFCAPVRERQVRERQVRERLVCGRVEALPIRAGWADVTLCGLTLGHVDDLHAGLAELRRVTRPGGVLLCSDFHPIGQSLGWQRTFRHAGQRYAVRYTRHLYSDWQRACRALNLTIAAVIEPFLDPMDIPPDAALDPVAQDVPVALVFALRHAG